MLVRFSSIETESITMFGDIAVQLIKMLGASGAIPGAIGAKDIPAAVQRLRKQLQVHAAEQSESSDVEPDHDAKDREPPVALMTRAGPLIDILERAGKADAPVMWEKA
jgi:hypothetical protein